MSTIVSVGGRGMARVGREQSDVIRFRYPAWKHLRRSAPASYLEREVHMCKCGHHKNHHDWYGGYSRECYISDCPCELFEEDFEIPKLPGGITSRKETQND